MKTPESLAVRVSLLVAAASALLMPLTGCQSYEIVQTNIFADDGANVVRIDYGRSADDHENAFVAPNGREMTFKSKLVVDVTLPDGDDFTAWQCMNFTPGAVGTLYRTDDEEWLCHVYGFVCVIYRECLRNGKKDYLEVFRGLLCESPKRDFEPDKRWRKLKKNAKGEWE